MFATQHIGGKGDYIALNIVDLSVDVRFDLGDAPVIIRYDKKRW